jgi:hypothetical protein
MTMYENAVGQLTNLKGILKTADELFAHDKRMHGFISYWGQAVRMSFRVKNQLINLVTGAARAIMNIERRLQNGIFDNAQRPQPTSIPSAQWRRCEKSQTEFADHEWVAAYTWVFQ